MGNQAVRGEILMHLKTTNEIKNYVPSLLSIMGQTQVSFVLCQKSLKWNNLVNRWTTGYRTCKLGEPSPVSEITINQASQVLLDTRSE